jgi:hypothetical protein
MRRSKEERAGRRPGGIRLRAGRPGKPGSGLATCLAGVRSTRAGVATIDYVLVLGVVLPLAAFVMCIGPRIIRLAYEMVCVLVSWPLM